MGYNRLKPALLPPGSALLACHPQRILDFRHIIGLLDQLADLLLAGLGGHPGPVSNFLSWFAWLAKIPLYFDLNRGDVNVHAPGLAVNIVAVAGRQSQEQHLPAVQARPELRRLGREHDRLGLAIRHHLHRVAARMVPYLRNVHLLLILILLSNSLRNRLQKMSPIALSGEQTFLKGVKAILSLIQQDHISPGFIVGKCRP